MSFRVWTKTEASELFPCIKDTTRDVLKTNFPYDNRIAFCFWEYQGRMGWTERTGDEQGAFPVALQEIGTKHF